MNSDTDLDPSPSDTDTEDPKMHIFCVGCFPRDDQIRVSYCGKVGKPRSAFTEPVEQWRKADGPPAGVNFCNDCLLIRPNCMKCRRK